MFREQKEKLEASNRWARELDEKLTAAGERIVPLQDELAAMRTGYEAKIAELDQREPGQDRVGLRLDADLNRYAQLNIVRASRWVKARQPARRRAGTRTNDRPAHASSPFAAARCC